MAKDFRSMDAESWKRLDTEFCTKMQGHRDLQQDPHSQAGIDERLSRMNSCLQEAIETCVPNKKRLSAIKRETSEETRRLYEARATKFSRIEARGGKVSAQLRKRWHRKIRDANLKDYNVWLEKMTTEMEGVDKKGDSEKIFRIVKIVSGLMTAASPQAPSVDKNDNMILDQEKLSQAWRDFLEGKFKATAQEGDRDPYEGLGPELISDPLTEQAHVNKRLLDL